MRARLSLAPRSISATRAEARADGRGAAGSWTAVGRRARGLGVLGLRALLLGGCAEKDEGGAESAASLPVLSDAATPFSDRTPDASQDAIRGDGGPAPHGTKVPGVTPIQEGDENGRNGTESQPGGDCDGIIDDVDVAVLACGTGVCYREDPQTCASAQLCSPRRPNSQDDADCNGVDDDCDGFVDEDFQGQVVTAFQGYSGSSAHTGFEAPSRTLIILHRLVPTGPGTGHGALSRVIVHDKAGDTSGGEAVLGVTGVMGPAASVEVMDEPPAQPSDTDWVAGADLTWAWRPGSTDGVAFANISQSACLTVHPKMLAGIDGFDVLLSSGEKLSLPNSTDTINICAQCAD